MKQPGKGDVARCSKGALGLITSDIMKRVVYECCEPCASQGVWDHCSNCKSGVAYVGIHLTDKIAPIGSPWSSRTPTVIGPLEVLIARAWYDEKLDR